MKVGIIRCMQTEDYCPGTTDFKMINNRMGAFQDVVEDIEIIGFVNCGGCPGKKAVLRAKELVKRGADTLVFASCMARQKILCKRFSTKSGVVPGKRSELRVNPLSAEL